MSEEDPMRFVAPMRRQAVRARIKAIEEFMKGPRGQEEAYQASKALGLSISSFHRLVKAWRESKDPTRLGVASPRKQRDPSIRHRMAAEHVRIVRDATAAFPATEKRERVVARAILMFVERGLRPPSRIVLRQLIDEIAPREKPTGIMVGDGRNALVVDHVALGIGVIFPGISAAIRPIASLLVDPEDGSVLALQLDPDEPSPGAVAKLITHALATNRIAARECTAAEPIRPIAIGGANAPEWQDLLGILKDCGCEATSLGGEGAHRDPWVFRYFGSTIAGVRLKPRLTSVPAARRAWTAHSSRDRPLSQAEATRILRERLSCGETSGSARTVVSRVKQSELVRRLTDYEESIL